MGNDWNFILESKVFCGKQINEENKENNKKLEELGHFSLAYEYPHV